jgi:hypothetical protein
LSSFLWARRLRLSRFPCGGKNCLNFQKIWRPCAQKTGKKTLDK